MHSAAKAPFRCTFIVHDVQKLEVMEKHCLDYEEYRSFANLHLQDSLVRNRRRDSKQSKPDQSFYLRKQMVILKVGDDVRQDMLTLQLIRMFKNIYDSIGLDLYLYPYNVVSTGPGKGVIECVPDSQSRDEIGRRVDGDMFQYFLRKFGPINSEAYQIARSNFIRSMAAYSVVVFILQIKDRHNGNILINETGHVIHIDFGFILEISPGGNIGIEPDIKLTNEMMLIMGGSEDSHAFEQFKKYSVEAYLALRPFRRQICNIVAMMLDTKLPCFLGRAVQLLDSRFQPELDDTKAAEYMQNIIYNCTRALRSQLYDLFQYYQNQIQM
ncbi:hypothetical protein ACOME3_009560 [Neoechinorhynchus agilis]